MRSASPHRRDEGIAMVVAIAVVALVSIVVVTLTTVTIYQSNATGRDRARSSAIASAEGLLDRLAAEISTTSADLLPCADLPENEVVIRDTLDSSATVTYFMDDSTTVVPCADIKSGVEAAFATIKVSTTSDSPGGLAPAERTIETLLRLTPTYSATLDKALFSQTGVVIGNNGDVLESPEDLPADVYTNGYITNNNGSNQVIEGSLLSQTDITWNKTLTVHGDVWAKNNVNLLHGSVAVSGNVISSTGDVVLDNGATVQKRVRSGGGITWTPCTAVKCFRDVEGLNAPEPQTFPPLGMSVIPAWEANGYSLVKTFSSADCSTASAWLESNLGTFTTPTIVKVDCDTRITFDGTDAALKTDVAVFARGGFTLKSAEFAGDATTPSGQRRLLHLIQPAGITCTSPGITASSQMTAVDKVALLLYSGCGGITLDNKVQMVGQVYAYGAINVSNNSDITFWPMDAWGTSASVVVDRYVVESLYKRENLS